MHALLFYIEVAYIASDLFAHIYLTYMAAPCVVDDEIYRVLLTFISRRISSFFLYEIKIPVICTHLIDTIIVKYYVFVIIF